MTLKVLSAGALKFIATELAGTFARATGHQVSFAFGTIGGVRKRLADGETADVIMGTSAAIAEMEQAGVLIEGSVRQLGRTLTGICVRAGRPLPDISTPEAFKALLLTAGSIAYTDPKAGGTSGIYLTGLMERLGIAEAVAPKALLCVNGDDVVEKVRDGKAEIGSTFISEIVPIKGVALAGPLPPPIGNATSYAGGIAARCSNPVAARAFIDAMADPAQRSTWVSFGFEP